MIKTIEFPQEATVEQRKYAINQAMESAAPFHLKKMLLDIPGHEPTDYTGGMTQMLLAKSITIEYAK